MNGIPNYIYRSCLEAPYDCLKDAASMITCSSLSFACRRWERENLGNVAREH